MDAFDPPAGDYAGIAAGATVLGTVSTDLGGDLNASTGAVKASIAAWKGTRRDEFAQAGGGVQMQLKLAGDGCAAVSFLLGQYAQAFNQTCADVAAYKRLSDHAFSNAATLAKTLNPTTTQYDMTFQHASRASAQYESDALAAKSDLDKLAARIAAQIDAETDNVAPVSSKLTPDQIRRQVAGELGLSGLTGTAAGKLTTDQAWALVGGAEKALPSNAVNADGSVDWTKAYATPAVPPAGSDPQAVNLWWNSLSPNEQNDLLNNQPGGVGNLNGVPVIDRDFANRINLSALKIGIQDQITALNGQEPPKMPPFHGGRPPINPYTLSPYTQAWQDWKNTMNTLQDQLDGLNKVSDALGMSSPDQLYLIGLQAVGNGRAIISRGNPDLAADVATYVPGMGTKLTGIAGGVTRASRMYTSAQNAGSTSTAVICWYGYDAPQGLSDAASYDDAKKGAQLLDNFQNGLRVTHDGPPSLNTVVAHSYGTTVTGYSASHGNTLNADNVVFVASPGVSVDHVDDLRLTGVDSTQNAQHVYATVGQYDPIQLAAGINGPSPADPDFGAHDFGADSQSGPWYELGWNPSAHSAYWDPGNKALTSMGEIVAGQGGSTK